MTPRATFLKKADIAHMLRAAAAITGRTRFVLVGTGAVIAQLAAVPLTLMRTREIDLHADGDADAAMVADLIDGTIGEGSQFDETFGYYAHGIEEGTAILPRDWRSRAVLIPLPDQPDVACICPDVNDIALSKLCAWRDKDRTWLRDAYASGLLDAGEMRSRVLLLDGVDEQVMQGRIGALVLPVEASPGLSGRAREGGGTA